MLTFAGDKYKYVLNTKPLFWFHVIITCIRKIYRWPMFIYILLKIILKCFPHECDHPHNGYLQLPSGW